MNVDLMVLMKIENDNTYQHHSIEGHAHPFL